MNIAFLILAHQYPGQLKALVDALLHYHGSKVFIHVDAKSEELYTEIKTAYANRDRVVLLEKRYPVYWGSYNQIQATISLLRSARGRGDYYCLLSGQDMPVKKVETYAEFLKKENKEFISWFQLPDSQWSGGGLNRLHYYSIDVPNHAYLSNKLNRIINKVQRILGYKRKISGTFYGGPNWFNLSNAAVEYVCRYLDTHPSYLKQFTYTRCADEIVIQSILLNSEFKSRVISKDLRVIDWASGPEYPRVWRKEDFERLIHSEAGFFARKFNEQIDPDIIQLLKQHVS